MKYARSLSEQIDHWVLPIVGLEVTRCYVDWAFGLELWTPAYEATLRIEGAFRLQTLDNLYELTPGHDPVAIAPALPVLHKTVLAATAYKTGMLEIHFSDGYNLSVPIDHDYEAWVLNATGGLKLVCLPGGGLAIWDTT